ncbi:DUF7310 family coiled-coil domain-containing protein [Natronoarchaeum rubrum]|uniref:DUF7310 family coiled-coil domain-containing protein n=1 Tax=Natronoarchaeum rubrum TaxID=755311 RepID=UPI0021125088|nr:hypothetical protein [Natronoarchaeum rubrum]
MTDTDAVEERLRAVERAVADGDTDIDGAPLGDPTGELASRIDELESTTTELESGLQAVRGYVGQVKSVDDEIEQRADAAAAAVDDVEERVAALERRLDGGDAEVTGTGAIEAADDDQTPSRATHSTGQSSGDRSAATGQRRHDEERPQRGDGRRPLERDHGHDGGPTGNRRSQSRAERRRPAAPQSRPPRTRPPAEGGAHGRHAGCPYCGGAAADADGSDPGRTPQPNNAAADENRPNDAGDPVDEVDEQGVVARLRDAL